MVESFLSFTSMDVKDKILQVAIEVLPRYGVKSVTMDELAQRLSMSKKTIYQHFKDKSELVDAVVEKMFIAQDEQIDAIKEKSHDAIEEMFLISVFMRGMLSSLDVSVIFDLRKYYPVAFERFRCHKDDNMKSHVVDNLKAGVEQGFYREEINIEILAKLKMVIMEGSFDPEMFPPDQHKIYDVQMELFDHFLYGVMTQEGLEKLNVYKDKYQVK